MKIALVGYGKMGKAIEQLATAKGHEVVLRISTANVGDFTDDNIRRADVAIEFTGPATAEANVLRCLNAGVPVVCGSTGWNDGVERVKALARANGTAFLFASNFSMGVQMFFEVNRVLAELMAGRPEYGVSLDETHHTQKKDAPSGTAVTLAEQILAAIPRLHQWRLTDGNATSPEEIPITSHRIDQVPGTHEVAYISAIDTIEIKHTAHNRSGFAAGVLAAAEFVCRKTGVFTMRDVMGW